MKTDAKIIAISPSSENIFSLILYNKCINIIKNPIGIADWNNHRGRYGAIYAYWPKESSTITRSMLPMKSNKVMKIANHLEPEMIYPFWFTSKRE